LPLLFFIIDNVAHCQYATGETVPVIYKSNGTETFKIPTGVTSIRVLGWGAEESGGDREKNKGESGGGGRAGAYSEFVLSVTPGATLYYETGSGSSTSGAGGDSWISLNPDGSNPIQLAKGSQSVQPNDNIGADGGDRNSGVGAITTSGGKGSDSDADGSSPGRGVAKTNGNNTVRGGSGGNGQITFTYPCDESIDPPKDCWKYIDDSSVLGVVKIEFFKNCIWDVPKGHLEFEVLAIGVGVSHSGGSGGIVHACVNIGEVAVFGLVSNTPFQISVGEGGLSSTSKYLVGGFGEASRFNSSGTYYTTAGGIYKLTGSGGGSASDSGENPSGRGDFGINSSKSNQPNTIQKTLYDGSGGGASHSSNGGGAGRRNGGSGDTHSGGAGGAVSTGANGNSQRSGSGGDGLQFNQFDGLRFFSTSGSGGSNDSFIALGGSISADGTGAFDGSGGGGGSHSGAENGGKGAKGVIIVRYDIPRTLPIEYLYFDSNYNSQVRTGELSWATAKEWENSHFEIERAVNNVREWKAIGEVSWSWIFRFRSEV